MAEGTDAAVSAERAAVAETRRRISGMLDEVDQRVRPPAKHAASALASLHGARSGFEMLSAAAATAGSVGRIVRSTRRLSKGELAVVVSGVAGVAAVLAWVWRTSEHSDR